MNAGSSSSSPPPRSIPATQRATGRSRSGSSSPICTRGARERSPAGDAHVACDGGAAAAPVDDEVVALGLARDRLLDRLLDGVVGFGEAEGRAQIRRVLLAEAHVELAGAGEPHAIAALAEIMGQ